MDSLVLEMQQLLASGRNDGSIQDIIGEFAGKNIDDLLSEADKIISETLPYFQTFSNGNEVKVLNNFERVIVNAETTQPKYQQKDTKKVVFNLKNDSSCVKISGKHSKMSESCGKLAINKYKKFEEKKKTQICSSPLINCKIPEFKVPEMNILKTQLNVSFSMLENHDRLQAICNKHNILVNNMKIQNQINKLKKEKELNYYKLSNNELEKNLEFKEQEIQHWKNQYQQLNNYCKKFSETNIKATIRRFNIQVNELIERSMNRESQLHIIINNLLEEIDQSHLQYRIQLSEKNKQIHNYLDKIEEILTSVYEFRNNDTKRNHLDVNTVNI